MLRLFQTNKIRKVEELEGDWDFQPIKQSEELPSDFNYRMPVPGCWEMQPDFLTYRGQGVFRREIDVPTNTSVRLNFKGISHTADVYFDGKRVAHHYNAYTPFTAVIPNVKPGKHIILVRVDNSFHEESKLHFANDYYTYGGIIRPVGIEYISDAFIERIQFTPYKNSNGEWQGNIDVIVSNTGSQNEEIELKGIFEEESISFESKRIKPNETVIFSAAKNFPDVKAWSHLDPQLYFLEVQLYKSGQESPSDDLIERVGFRTVTTLNGKIQINDEDIVLKGFNRHEDHPMVGAAFPYQLMVQDVDLMIHMGANSVRTSHYPNDERFLDLCDERGIFVWEENHARGFLLSHMQDPKTQQQCLACNKEMVFNHFNHPSIIIWAILNECASNTLEGKELYREQIEQIKEMDQSRPVSFASHHREHELCFDLADIVSFNLYPLWYTNEDPGELAEKARQWADELGGLGKPMIMSEFGGDGYYGLRDPNNVRGTEERQAEIIEKNLAAYTSSPFISGMYIWQFCDCRVVEDTGWLLSRAGTQNSKGIVDRYRRPKLAAEVVKKYFKIPIT